MKIIKATQFLYPFLLSLVSCVTVYFTNAFPKLKQSNNSTPVNNLFIRLIHAKIIGLVNLLTTSFCCQIHHLAKNKMNSFNLNNRSIIVRL